MTTWAVLATGPSMSQEVADSIRGRARCVAVSDAYRLAPWADALASTDYKWWAHHQDAQDFAGRKFTACPTQQGLLHLERIPGMPSASNSGLLGCRVAAFLGATRILLLGFDFKGSHFFGAHPEPLGNPTQDRFRIFRDQFKRYAPMGVDFFNCTPESGLDLYPHATIEEALC